MQRREEIYHRHRCPTVVGQYHEANIHRTGDWDSRIARTRPSEPGHLAGSITPRYSVRQQRTNAGGTRVSYIFSWRCHLGLGLLGLHWADLRCRTGARWLGCEMKIIKRAEVGDCIVYHW